ncbi:MAG: membrane dipeptidase [Deltaproteobacteria bacterium]|nr:membrane dipeptidase [Deltaproteobacteria bacterium]
MRAPSSGPSATTETILNASIVTTCLPSDEVSPWQSSFDGHVDLLYSLMKEQCILPFAKKGGGPISPSSLRDGKVRIFNSAIFCNDKFNGSTAVQHVTEQLFLMQALTASLSTIRTREELETAWGTPGFTSQMLLLENADALVDIGTSFLRGWGVHTIGLTHVGRNRLADGNTTVNPEGLTKACQTLLPNLETRGFVIDIAHLAEVCFWELLDSFHGHLCCSHTGLRHFCDTPRNLGDDQISVLLSRNGVIGLSFAPEMLSTSGKSDCRQVFEQIDYLVQRWGSRGFALGSDLGGYETNCSGLESHAQLENLVELMVQAGYPKTEIDALLGGNWFEFYLEALPNGLNGHPENESSA